MHEMRQMRVKYMYVAYSEHNFRWNRNLSLRHKILSLDRPLPAKKTRIKIVEHLTIASQRLEKRLLELAAIIKLLIKWFS